MPVEIKLMQLNFMGSVRYYVSSDGHVYSKKKSGFIKLSEYADAHGYMRCCLTVNNKQYRKKVHTLVLESFNGSRPKGLVCRHLDGDKTNNNLSNLTWGTQAQNMNDRKRHGTMCCGENHYLSTVSDDMVFLIREMFANGIKQKQIADTLGVSKYSVHNYVRGKSRRNK